MICPLCGRERDGEYNIKIQQVNADGSKTNFVNSRICYQCTAYLVGLFASFTQSTEPFKNAELRAESEKEEY